MICTFYAHITNLTIAQSYCEEKENSINPLVLTSYLSLQKFDYPTIRRLRQNILTLVDNTPKVKDKDGNMFSHRNTNIAKSAKLEAAADLAHREHLNQGIDKLAEASVTIGLQMNHNKFLGEAETLQAGLRQAPVVHNVQRLRSQVGEVFEIIADARKERDKAEAEATVLAAQLSEAQWQTHIAHVEVGRLGNAVDSLQTQLAEMRRQLRQMGQERNVAQWELFRME